MEFPFTFKCNNKCISCILDLRQTKNMGGPLQEQIISFIDNTPKGEDLAFTGGEPTLREEVFDFLEHARKKHPESFLFLVTNSRSFADEKFVKKLVDLKLGDFRIGSALYSHDPKIHDKITQAKGSWVEAVQGIKNLLKLGFNVELRVIVQKANYRELEKTAEFIADNFKGIERVVFINMKFTGNAFINRKDVFVRYSKAAEFAEKAAELLLKEGFEVMLFHFPLCIIDRAHWPLAEGTTKQEIELTLLDKCSDCLVKDRCPKIWKTYLPLAGEEEFEPITKLEN